MSAPGNCCTPVCATTEIVEVPGTEGAPGVNGLDGINAFTFTTDNFVVPAINGSATVLVESSAMFSVGAVVFIAGAGYFEITAIPGSASLTLKYLDYTANTNAGITVNAGTLVTAGGTQGPQGTAGAVPTPTTYADYAVGQSDVVTDSSTAITGATVTLTLPGTYMLLATVRLDYVGATYSVNETATVKLRETNNGPADIPNAIRTVPFGETGLLWAGELPPVIYTAAAGDVIEIFGVISALPASGDVEAVEGSITALKLF